MVDGILDTSVIIDLLRGVEEAHTWFEQMGSARLAVTPIIWMETLQGAVNKADQARAIRLLRRYALEHTTPDDHNWAIRQLIRFHLSHHVGYADLLIASVAARLDAPLYTLNVRHFDVLPGVRVVQPY